MKTSEGKRGKKIRFQLETDPNSQVFVAGTFNDWDATRRRMRDNPESGVFSATLTLPPGRHEYKFVVNGQWLMDPKCREWTWNEHGTLNGVVTV